MKKENKKLVTCVLLAALGIFGLVFQYITTFQAHKEKNERNAVFQGTVIETEESTGPKVAETVEETEQAQPADDVDPQTYDENENTANVYFTASDTFYEDLFPVSGYESIAEKTGRFLRESGCSVTGELRVREESIFTDDRESVFEAVPSDNQDITVHVVFDKETGEYDFSLINQ